jgi:hypothetical protein
VFLSVSRHFPFLLLIKDCPATGVDADGGKDQNKMLIRAEIAESRTLVCQQQQQRYEMSTG